MAARPKDPSVSITAELRRFTRSQQCEFEDARARETVAQLDHSHRKTVPMPLSSRRAFVSLAAISASLAFVAGCTPQGGGNSSSSANPSEGGAKGDPNPKKLVFGFVPSVEADKIADNAKPMTDYLTKALGIPVESYTSTQYNGLIEAMGSGKVDIGSLPTLGYVLAKDQNAADIILKTVRKGSVTYHSMFVARADSGIKKIEDAKGKRIAFVDSQSTSGFLFPAAYLKARGINATDDSFFSRSVYAGAHDSAIKAVYNGDVDVAAVYDDARDKVVKIPAYKDVMTKVVKIGDAGEIPNDTISVRTGLDPALVQKIKDALVAYAKTPEGKKTLYDTYGVDDVVTAQDSDYDPVRKVARSMDVNIKDVIDHKKPAGSPSPGASASPAVSTAASASPSPAASASSPAPVASASPK